HRQVTAVGARLPPAEPLRSQYSSHSGALALADQAGVSSRGSGGHQNHDPRDHPHSADDGSEDAQKVGILLSEVKIKRLRWVWPERIPPGKSRHPRPRSGPGQIAHWPGFAFVRRIGAGCAAQANRPWLATSLYIYLDMMYNIFYNKYMIFD